MLCPHCTDYKTLYRSVARSRAWIESCIHFLSEKSRRRIDSDALESSFAGYFLTIFTAGKDLDRSTADALEDLKLDLVKLTKLPQGEVHDILFKRSQREISQRTYAPPALETQTREGAFIRLGQLLLYSPKDDISVETLLRYELIKRSWKLDWSLCEGIVINAVPTTLGEGDYYSLYDDPETLGVFNLFKKRKGTIYSTILSSSKTYNKQILDLVLSVKNTCVVLTQDADEADAYEGKKGYTVYKLVNPEFYIITMEEYMETAMKEFQKRIPSLPAMELDFQEMFRNLEEIARKPPVKWARSSVPHVPEAISTPDLKLGLVSRSYPHDYYETDSISDVFSYKQRLSCHTTNRKTGKEKQSQVELWRKHRVFYHSFVEKHKLSTKEELLDYFYQHAGACGIFNAALAVYVYKRFGGKGSRVLDGFAGWTDRLIAAAAADCKEYRGFDTNGSIPYKEALEELRKMKGNLIDGYSVEILPFEQAELEDNHFDIALLSPPFFRYEIYEGKTTSTVIHKELTDWISNFWEPCLRVTLNAMRIGGWILLYLPAGNDETALAMRKAVGTVFEGRVLVYEQLGFVQTTKNESGNIRHLFVYRKLP